MFIRHVCISEYSVSQSKIAHVLLHSVHQSFKSLQSAVMAEELLELWETRGEMFKCYGSK